MRRSLTLLTQATGVAVVCLVAYRGAQLYCRNDITVYMTEVVRLPETLGRRRRPHQDTNLTLTIDGRVEVETCLMRSYRFLLRLSGQVRSSLLDATKNNLSSPRSARHRVLYIQGGSGHGKFRDDDTASNASVTTGSGRKQGPTLQLTSVDPVVDVYEADGTGTIAFTPGCIAEGPLCRYSCTASNNANSAGEEMGSSGLQSLSDGLMQSSSVAVGFSTSFSPASGGSMLQSEGSGLGNLYIRTCYLESDGATAYGQRLFMQIEFIRPVSAARVVIRLPSRHCQLHRSSTGGLGRLTQLLQQPRKFVWDIGPVTAEMCAVSSRDSLRSATLGDVEAQDSIMASVVLTQNACAQLEFVFEQPPPGVSFGEEYDKSHGGDGDESVDSSEEEEHRFNSTGGSNRSGSARWHTLSGRRARSRARSSSMGAASATGRSHKREERARKASEKARRIEEGGSAASHNRGMADAEIPTVELLYSVDRLLSGTSVKKLQVLQEAPNWMPRSPFDRLVLQNVAPSLETMKLKKFAHYTTWFVQPVAVSQT